MRKLALFPLVLVCAPLHAQNLQLPPGIELQARIDGDLNGDAIDDIAYVAGNDEGRELAVLLSVKSGTGVEFRSEAVPLELTPHGPGTLAIEGNVLTFEDLTGGTTAIASTRRYRFDGLRKRMRLIGMDATLYSRTNAHDGFEASWNLITGDAATRELKLVEGAGEDAYADGRKRRFKQRVRPLWLADSPDPETMLDEMRQD